MSKRGVLLLAVLAACGHDSSGAAYPDPPPSLLRLQAPADASVAAPLEKAGSPLIAITPKVITLDGETVSELKPEEGEKLIRFESLDSRLKARRDSAASADAGELAEDFWVEAANDAPLRAAISAIMTARFAGFHRVHLKTETGWADVGALEDPRVMDSVDLANVHRKVSVWLEGDTAHLTWQSDLPCEVVPADVDTTGLGLRAALDAACRGLRCVDGAAVSFPSSVPFARVAAALEVLRAHSSEPYTFGLWPHSDQPPHHEHVCGMPLRRTLPPEAIQMAVRDSYKIRRCYSDGLSRNPKLQGKVVVRFKIDRESRVELAELVTTAAPNSPIASVTTITDSRMNACVVEAFRELHFEGKWRGNVTAVYPIVFTPPPD